MLEYLDRLLTPGEFSDMAPNGLQVPGAETVAKVATGVSAGLELFERAADWGAELLVVHHGIFWDFHPRALGAQQKRRLEVLFEAKLNLAAYHLPLDAHPEVGNNALLRDLLGFQPDPQPFGEYRGRSIGARGTLGTGIPIKDLVACLERELGQQPLVFPSGPDPVRSIGIVSGGAASTFQEAIAEGMDAFLTGEPAEHVMNDAHENGIHFVAGGHYATETLGVRRLGDLLAAEFGAEHRFLDVPNPI
jgi:dinuclear metal center YbgI/SA1388 family protein